MTDRVKITDMDELTTPVGDDWAVIVDVSDTTQSPQGTTKKIKRAKLRGLNWQGVWSAGTYVRDDAVNHNGSSWIATAVSTTEEPSDSATDWDLLAEKGAQGDAGPGVALVQPTGAINGVNTTFTVPSIPLMIIYGGSVFFETNNPKGYSRSGLTIEMPYPPTTGDADIFYAVL